MFFPCFYGFKTSWCSLKWLYWTKKKSLSSLRRWKHQQITDKQLCSYVFRLFRDKRCISVWWAGKCSLCLWLMCSLAVFLSMMYLTCYQRSQSFHLLKEVPDIKPDEWHSFLEAVILFRGSFPHSWLCWAPSEPAWWLADLCRKWTAAETKAGWEHTASDSSVSTHS